MTHRFLPVRVLSSDDASAVFPSRTPGRRPLFLAIAVSLSGSACWGGGYGPRHEGYREHHEDRREEHREDRHEEHGR